MNRFAFIFMLFSSAALFAQQVKVMQFREEKFDFGTVKEDGGPVIHEFLFTNTSGRPITIINVLASCGCTTPAWTKDPVPPGKTGFIQASYDPRGRPGFFNKTLTVTSDADTNPVILQIQGIVSTEGVGSEADFQTVSGNWKFKSSLFNMGKVYLNGDPAVRDFPFLNAGVDPVKVTKVVAPDYITVEVTPSTVDTKSSGHVKIIYDGKKRNRYGHQNDNVEIHTNDELEPVKSFTVYATLEDYFGELKPEDMAKAPRLTLSTSTLDMGRVRDNSTVVREVTITNNGRSVLNIHAAQPNCTCVSAQVEKPALKPGESTTMKITFDSHGRKASQLKAVTLYSNDPQNPVQRFTFSAYVEN